MKYRTCLYHCVLANVCCWFLLGCQSCPPRCPKANNGPAYDRPFPLGQVTDAHWETQQTNAQASAFVFYDHEFTDNTATLTPLGEKHMQQVALRLSHVPFPVVVEQSVDNKNRTLDAARRLAVVERLTRLGACKVDQRVVVAPAIAEGITAIEGEAAYYSTIQGGNNANGNNSTVAGRGFGGFGGVRQ